MPFPLWLWHQTFFHSAASEAMGQYATSPRRAKSNELLHAPIVPLLLVAPNAFDYTPTPGRAVAFGIMSMPVLGEMAKMKALAYAGKSPAER
jgi:hypothetical protein